MTPDREVASANGVDPLESALLYRAAFDWARDAVFIADAETGMILEANRAAQLLTGRSLEELRSMRHMDLHPPEDRARTTRNFETSLEAPGLIFGDSRIQRKDGHVVPAEISATGVLEIDGRRLVVGVVRDTSERQRVLDELRESTERYRLFLDGLAGITFRANPVDFRAEFQHGPVEQLTGYTPEELSSGVVSWGELIDPDDAWATRSEMGKLASVPGYAVDMTYRIRRKDGEIRWVRDMSRNVVAGGRPVVEGTVYDVTAEHAAQEALRLSEERFSKVFHTTPDFMGINRLRDGLWLDVNEGFTAMTGYSAEEAIGKTSGELSMWVDDNARDRFAAELRENGVVVDYDAEFGVKDGSIRFALVSAATIELEGEECLLTIGRDITRRKRVEEQLLTLNRELERLTEERTAALADANRRLAEARRADSEFLASLSREFRAPVDSILEACVSMLGGRVGELSGDQLDELRMVDSVGRHLLVLVNDLLDLAEVESGKAAVEVTDFRVGDLLATVRDVCGLQAAIKGVELACGSPIEDVRMHADLRRARHILLTLVGSAVRLTEQGRIVLSADVRNDDVVFAIAGTGGGPGTNGLPRVFDQIMGPGSEDDPDTPDAGPWLTVAMRLARVLGGDVTVERGRDGAPSVELRIPRVISGAGS